jgi:hypothetical protein
MSDTTVTGWTCSRCGTRGLTQAVIRDGDYLCHRCEPAPCPLCEVLRAPESAREVLARLGGRDPSPEAQERNLAHNLAPASEPRRGELRSRATEIENALVALLAVCRYTECGASPRCSHAACAGIRALAMPEESASPGDLRYLRRARIPQGVQAMSESEAVRSTLAWVAAAEIEIATLRAEVAELRRGGTRG